MDLKDFVAASLTQIVQGVAESAAAIREAGGLVNPAFYAQKGEAGHVGTTKDGSSPGSGSPVYAVKFDVAVVASSAESVAGGGEIKVAGMFNLGGKTSGTDKDETTSRIQFVVPLVLPTDSKSVEAANAARLAAKVREDADTAKLRGSSPRVL